MQEVCGESTSRITIRDGMDFEQIAELARELSVPLIRVGFPVHDRFGAQRLAHIGYRGTQQLFDRIVCAIQEKRQEQSEVGYAYL